jgi:serine/threonine-protein kinase
MRWGYRGVEQSSFRIPPRLTAQGELDLTLVVTSRDLAASRFDLAPRLTDDDGGDAPFVFVREFNEWSATAAAVMSVFSAFGYGLVFLRDRRRVAYGWYALETCGAMYTLMQNGVLQLVVGPYELSVVAPLICIGELASVHFTHAIFKLGRPHWIWTAGAAASVVAALAMPDPFVSQRWLAFVATVMTCANVAYQACQMARVARRSGLTPQVAAIFASWVVLGIVGAPDIVSWCGLGEVAGGFRGVPLGLALITTLQSMVLSRDHHDALVRSERLNEELRRQIASRADTLAAALMRASTMGLPARSLTVGDRLDDRYEIVRRLGAGAAGTVYEVLRLTDGGRFALKVLHAAADTTDMARFAREAQLIAKLDHPNVVRIVDVDVNPTGLFYLVVELVEGRSLGDHRARFGDPRWALRVLSQIADGLAAVHAQGIVHRDLKPSNILVTEAARSGDLVVRIADFGIAGQTDLRELPPGMTGELTAPDGLLLTTTGMWIGTPKYMAPELADGAKKADRPSDVFALGLIAYELLTGAFPYEGSAALREMKGETYKAPPSVRSRCPDIDVAVADAVDACLAADPRARPSAGRLAELLRRQVATSGAGVIAATS